MREQLKLLEKLQQVDAKLHETQDILSSLPTTLLNKQEDVQGIEALLDKERQDLSDVQAYKANLDSSMKADQAQLTKAKSKLSQVRTSKEYMATQRELETNRKGSSEREEELAKLRVAIEKFQLSISTHEEDLKALQDHVAAEEKKTRAKIAELEKEMELKKAERGEMAATVKRQVLNKYQAIRRRRGNAVVQARRGVCLGCNMQLPPQLYNILQRGESIEYCPNCQRIVYFEPEE